MYNQMERELKLLVSEENFNKIIKSYDFSNPWKQTNTYYDTKNRDIKAVGAMRIRKIDNKKIFTLKIRKDKITQYEYEKEIDCEDIKSIKDQEILDWIGKLDLKEEVNPIVTFSTYRRIYYLDNAELCADMTVFPDHTDYEIEYEYTKPHDGIKVFNEILSNFNLIYEKNSPSKIARAFGN